MYAAMAEKGLRRSTIWLTHRLIKQVLTHAVKHDVLVRNVAMLATPPRPEKTEVRVLSRDEARRFLEVAGTTRLAALWTLALSTGMRLSEMLALEWHDFDPKRRTISVNKTLQRLPKRDGGTQALKPKTRFSERTIDITPQMAEALRAHRARQAAERLVAGPLWLDKDLIFCNEAGGYLHDSIVREYHFEKLLKPAGLPHTRIHDLRHSAATLLLEDGVSPLTVSKMLGHSSVALTLDLYGHVTSALRASASDAMSRILFG